MTSKLNNNKFYSLSPMQKGMLFHCLEQSAHNYYIQQFVCELSEELDLGAFESAWQTILERHEVLRTKFEWRNLDEPIQSVCDQVVSPINFEDWSSVSDQGSRLEAILEADRQKSFILEKAPLLRFALFKFDVTDYRFVWTHHHIILDGRSYFTLFIELFELYAAYKNNEKIELNRAYPYREYINYLEQQNFSDSQQFWRDSLKGVQAPTPLIKKVQSSVEEKSYLETTHRLTEQLTSKLNSFVEEHDLTLNTLVQAAWAILLSRYSGEDKVIFGATRACRHWTGIEPSNRVGIFIGTLPLCIELASDLDVMTWLIQLRKYWVEMREYEHTPLTQIHQWSEIKGDSTLFESILVFEGFDLNDALRDQGADWLNRTFTLHQTTNYPLVLSATAGKQLNLIIEYETARFDAGTIHRMFGHLQTILQSLIEKPNQSLSEVPILTDTERTQLLVEWNQTKADFPSEKCMHQLFEEQVEKTPDAIAIEFGDQRLTYSGLNTRANQIAHHLISRDVKPDDLIGLSVGRSFEMIVGLMGVLKAGAAYVPLDPAYPEERLKFILEDSGIEVLLNQEYLEQIDEQNTQNPRVNVTPNNLVYVIYTSGSTGKPKGVLIEHKSLVNHNTACIDQYKLTAEDKILQFSSFSFDVAAEEIFPVLICGATLILWEAERVNEISDIASFIALEQLTILNLPAQYWHTWVLCLINHNQILPECLRLVIAGSETVPLETVKLWHQFTDIDLRNAYGPTECTITATTYKTGLDDGSTVSIGKPISNTEIFILDNNHEPVPIGVPGELHIGGIGLARGYLDRPELTAKSFVSLFDQRLYKTGDLVRYLASGDIEFIGRIDNQVKIRGFRIELGEIESVLMQCEGVNEAAVIVREDQPGDKRLVAYIVGSKEGLRENIKAELPGYMIPAGFVSVEKMPLTPSGKIDRQALLVLTDISLETQEEFVAPRNQSELKLTIIWQHLLGVNSVSVYDNFFEMGGHSLLAITLLSKVEAEFNKAVSVITLFQGPTIAELAVVLEDEDNQVSPWRALLPIQAQGNNRPLFFIGTTDYARRIVNALGEEQPVYGLNMFGLYSEEATDVRVTTEGMAAAYIKEIQTVQPNGPYQLCGFCADAKVAFEMAQQFVKRGQEVTYLGFIDVDWYANLSPSLMHRAIKLKENLSKFGFHFITHKIKSRVENRIKAKVLSDIEQEKQELQRLDKPLPLQLQHQFYIKAFYKALDNYKPQPYVGKLNLLLSTEFFSEWNSDKRFSDQISGLAKEVIVEEVSGYHDTLFDEPQASIVGKLISVHIQSK